MSDQVVMPQPVIEALTRVAEAAYPEECCGLIVGQKTDDGWRVSRLAESANVAAADKDRRFEVDPGLIARLYRELRGTEEEVLGVFHSHPSGAPSPSDEDRARAYDPDYLWLIAAVPDGICGDFGCYLRVGEVDHPEFQPLALRIV